MTTHNWKVGDQARVIAVDDEDIAQGLKIGDIVTIQGNYEYGVEMLGCIIRDAELWGVYIGQIEPLPTETPKDPFAPGEYVTCVVASGDYFVGVTVKVSNKDYPISDTNGFMHEHLPHLDCIGSVKSRFRRATPEEIAAYKAKYEAEPAVDPKPEPDPRITFTVGGQEFYVGQRVWSDYDYGLAPIGKTLEIIGPYNGLVVTRVENTSMVACMSAATLSTTPPTPHEWKRGDWARHEKFGSGFVYATVKDGVNDRIFVTFEDQIPAAFKPSELTFISHTEIPE